MDAEADDPERTRRERDLYRQLLELGHNDEIEPFLQDALSLIVQVTGAKRGYLELQDDRAAPLFSMARCCSAEEVTNIRTAFSRGVIAEALAGGKTIATASALVDPRFKNRKSVRENRIEAVLCAPIGGFGGASSPPIAMSGTPPLGVLYLQDRDAPGPFSEQDRLLAETFARTVAVFADRLLIRRRRRDEEDPTLSYRRLLHAEGIVGRSHAIARLLQRVSVAAPLDVGILLTGSPGTGKTQLARLCHESSPRAKGPFVELNCAMLTETLFESRLFGHKRGAFTSADRDKTGLVHAAEGGTLFLDEVAEIPLASQAKLLTFLESKEYYPVGGTHPVRADIRIIAATNADLQAAVKQRAFREDLYYRLDVMPIALPSLAERREDVEELVRHFCRRAVEEHKCAFIEPSEGALRAAEAAEWPGNVRQLDYAVKRAVAFAAAEGLLRMERRHLFPDDDRAGKAAGDRLHAGATPVTFQAATRAFQAELLQKALEEAEWNVTETATRLDLTRAHVYNLIKAFGLGRPRA